MLKSMTGYGSAQAEGERRQFSVEVRSLNSRNLDLMLKLPRDYSDKEHEVRTLIANKLERGKVGVFIEAAEKAVSSTDAIDAPAIKARYQAIVALAEEMDVEIEFDRAFELALRQGSPGQNGGGGGLPQKETDEQLEWALLRHSIDEALNKCVGFREQEGQALEKALLESNSLIRHYLDEVKALDPARLPRIRERLNERLEEVMKTPAFDAARLEQEMVYFSEKLDVAEEIVRLTNHLDYFEQTIRTDPSAGKKIGFISQEMGREINTIGSKANDFAMQQTVVKMKEELEKIKEQSANIL